MTDESLHFHFNCIAVSFHKKNDFSQNAMDYVKSNSAVIRLVYYGKQRFSKTKINV